MPIHRWILAIASRLVPRSMRAEWLAEWDAEIRYRESTHRAWPAHTRRRRHDLIEHSVGAIWDALWLQSSRWYSLRLFGRHWRLTLAAVLSLSIALTATVIGFAAYNALLFRPPGVGDPGSLRSIHVRTDTEAYGPVSFAEYKDYRERTRAFSDIAAFPYSITTVNVSIGDRRAQAVSSEATSNFFSVLGVSPRAGRLALAPARGSSADEVVVSYAFWRTLGADPSLVGATARLNDHPVTIVGVLPESFRGMTLAWDPDVWVAPETHETIFGSPPALLNDRSERWLHMTGRLRPGVAESQARADVGVVSAGIVRDHPATDRGRAALLTPLTVTPPGDRSWMGLLLGGLVIVVLLTLVVACSNVTNLLLGLSSSRRHEMSIRAALGASRLQLAAPLLWESVVLCLVASGLGCAAAYAILVRLSTFMMPALPWFPAPSIDLTPDVVVIGATLLVTLVAGVAVGLPAALRAAAEGLSVSLIRELTAAPRQAYIRSVLVVIQMGVATIAMIGVGVSIRSFLQLRHASLGFSARSLHFAEVDMPRSGYDEHTGPQMYERMRERLGAEPGVEAVALASVPPLAGSPRDFVVREGDGPPSNGHGAPTPYAVVDDRYFDTLGIHVIGGRTFDSRDRPDRPEVVVINETMARRLRPGDNAIGQRLRIENGNRLVQVIGVVADVKYEDLTEPQLPFMYFALGQHYLPTVTAIARTSTSRPLARDALPRALAEIEPRIVFTGIGTLTLDDLLQLAAVLPRLIMTTVTILGAVTLGLAIFGLYSTVFYSVSQRRSEIGIRVALGAQSRDVFALALRQTGWVALAGAITGLIAGMSLLPLVSSFFYGIAPIEPGVVLVVALICVAIALLTTYIVTKPWTHAAALDLLRR